MGWILISVVLPLTAPLIALLFLRPLALPEPLRPSLSLMVPLKDGQLCWGAISFCASSLYELGVRNWERTGITTSGHGYLIACLIVLLVVSSLLAAGGAIFPTSNKRPAGVEWHAHYRCFLVSLALTFWAALAYILVHYEVIKR
ncbi:hypothetical protein [Pseudoduganella violacea]|uniref:Uncharacterized protein n=1 Tax=Pseudoduganella violacea TaxID=1715466 RepID=A0A7W5B908_9BURK|nr:hypothetical protein [Pseudoduganella violacea]MBB3118756.1 hypothetical protein [Pseudoduganella violacea]